MNVDARLTWIGNRGAGTATYESYGRDFRVSIDGKPELTGSADPRFRGDPQLHSPEDFLLAALVSCHMLSYLALCARTEIRVLEYTDHAHGLMTFDARGGGRFESVVLRPIVTLADERDLEAAKALHDMAHELCFIASSCNFPVRHEAGIRVAAAGVGIA